MSLNRFVLVAAALACACDPDPVEPAEVADPLAYADPRMGSGGFAFAAGSAYPGASVPNGLVKAGPDTNGPYGTIRFLHYSGYWAGDDAVQGFSHLHLHGTGAADYGLVTVMPMEAFDATRTTARGYESKFDKASEVARPGYYATTLERGGIRAELTATTRGAHHRWSFADAPATGHVVVDLAHVLDGGEVKSAEIELVPEERAIRGRLRHEGDMSGGYGGYDVFFEARTKQPWRSKRTWSGGGAPADATAASGSGVGAVLELALDGGRAELLVALSFVSAEGARRNLEAELPSFDFEGTRRRAEDEWRARLRAVRVFGGSERDRRIFYSSLHHAFMMPTITSDVDGTYRFAGKTAKAEGFSFVSDLSLWDTYRTLHPLYGLVARDRARDSAQSLVRMAQLGGSYPKWPLATGETGVMLGASADIVLADAWAKGVRDWDVEAGYELARAAALDEADPPGGRGGRDDTAEYRTLGFVPATRHRSVSLTTEFAHADYALAQLAAGLGKTDDAAKLLERSRGYRRLFDPATGYLRPHTPDGELLEGAFDPDSWDHYAEANARQSVWMAAHDLDGLAALFGGPDAFVAALGKFFEDSRTETEALPAFDPEVSPDHQMERYMPRRFYWHGNEPDIHAPFLFAQAGRPDLAAKWVRWARETSYTDGPDGLAGNDDGGTLGAWYVFSALGLYPIPGSDRYIVTAPLFPRIVLAVPGGAVTIEAEWISAANAWVEAVTLDGRALGLAELRHADLRPGSRLVFRMGPDPVDWVR